MDGDILRNSAQIPTFRYRTILIGTLLLTLITAVLPTGIDSDLLILATAGFPYGIVLVVSLARRTTIARAIIGVLILGLTNYPGHLFLVSALGQIAGDASVILVFPALAGAAVTVLVLKWLWTVRIGFFRAIVLIVAVLPAGLYWYWSDVSNSGDVAALKEWLVAILEILWWWGFTLGLVLTDRSARLSRA